MSFGRHVSNRWGRDSRAVERLGPGLSEAMAVGEAFAGNTLAICRSTQEWGIAKSPNSGMRCGLGSV